MNHFLASSNQLPVLTLLTAGTVRTYLAVASAYGEVNMYMWERSHSRFSLHHTLEQAALPFDEDGCSCICDEGVEGACFDGQGAGGVLEGTGTARTCALRDSSEVKLYPRKIKYFQVSSTSEHFIAVAYYNSKGARVAWSNSAGVQCTRVYTHIFRWSGDVPQDQHFVVMQAVPTHGAIDVDFAEVEHASLGTLSLLTIAEFADGGAASSPVLRWMPHAYNRLLNTQVGIFAKWDTVSTHGAFALRVMHLVEVGTILGVANRQNAPFGGVDLSVYDEQSCLLRWNGTGFEMLQELVGFGSVPEDFDPETGVGSWARTAGLRGTSDFTLLHDSDGEAYLLVAQSVCDPMVTAGACNGTIQPQSAILQWDPATNAFGEVRALTAGLYQQFQSGRALPAAASGHHRTALRLPAGRLGRWTVMRSPGGLSYLVAASKDRGVRAFAFRFRLVTGLRGAAACAVDPEGSTLFVASELDRALVALNVHPRKDALGDTVAQLAIHDINAFGLVPLETGPVPLSAVRVPRGLAGVRGMRVQDEACAAFVVGPDDRHDTCRTVHVLGGQLRNEFLCSDAPPIGAAGAIDPLEPPAICRDVTLSVKIISLSNPDLFGEAPSIDGVGSTMGTLRFTPRNGQVGSARVQVEMEKSGPASAGALLRAAAEFNISVVNVNLQPVVEVKPVMVNWVTGTRTVQFTTNIVAEGTGLTNYSWLAWAPPDNLCDPDPVVATDGFALPCSAAGMFEPDCEALRAEVCIAGSNGTLFHVWPYVLDTSARPALLQAEPVFSFTQDVAGRVQGMVTLSPVAASVTGRVRVLLRMDDGSSGTAETGAYPYSEVVVLEIDVPLRNFPPTFQPSPLSFSLMEDAGLVSVTGFVKALSKGSPAEATQQVVFTLGRVEGLATGFDPESAPPASLRSCAARQLVLKQGSGAGRGIYRILGNTRPGS